MDQDQDRPLTSRERLTLAAVLVGAGLSCLASSACSQPATHVLPAVAPAPYTSTVVADEYAHTVMIFVACGDGRVVGGSGVRVGGAVILTAAHVVYCGGEDRLAAVELASGSDYVATVVTESLTLDIARLEVPGMPPTSPVHLGPLLVGQRACATFAIPEVGRRCGDAWPRRDTRAGDLHLDLVSEHGNSGGPVWGEDGSLVGIMVHLVKCRGTDTDQACTAEATSVADLGWLATP